MSKNNSEIKEKPKPEPEPLTFRRFVRQRAGLRAVKERKRKEKHAMNKMLHASRKAKKAMKKMGISDQIQRGRDIAKRWQDEQQD